jgi:hypothetical protein
MGVYTEVEAYITFEGKVKAEDAYYELEDKVIEFIKSEGVEGSFTFQFSNCDLEGNCIIILICSERYQNAIWQTEQLHEYIKKAEGVEEFSADISSPDNFISWNIEDE